jgi:hypothetical protein
VINKVIGHQIQIILILSSRAIFLKSSKCIQDWASNFSPLGLNQIYRVIRLRCHKNKRKPCRKESTLLPVNGMYTCRRGTTFVSQHITTQSDRHGGCGTVHTEPISCATWRATFPEWSVQRPRWSSVGGQLHSVVFVHTQVTWRTPTRKSLEASSPWNSRAMGWAHHGRISDFCMCRLKTTVLWERMNRL